MDITMNEVIESFKQTLFERNQYGETSNYCFTYNEDLTTFTDPDGEVEYQIRGCGKTFCSILVRFCNDKTYTYKEFYIDGYDWISEMIYDVLSETTIDELCDRMERKYVNDRV